MKEEILRLLRSADGYISGQELCNRFGVSRTAVWKAINQLKEAGYEIEAQQNKGYRLMAAPDLMTEAEIKSLMHTEWVAKEVLYFDTIDSTNIKAQELAEKGYPSGTLVVADKQESGKGRRGRSWVSPSGTGIFMTLMIKPDINPNNASMLTLVAALAVAKAITSVTGEEALIKWPNDIVVNGKKVCGILTEMNAQFDYINHIVVGIGINVHNESFPEEISQMASSLMIEAGGKRFHRAQIIAETMSYFEQYYDTFLKTQDLSALVREYDELLVNRNKSVRVLDPKEPFDGKAMGITPKGELIVDTWESRKLVSSGEVYTDMSKEVVLCVSNAYQKKYYLNENFNGLPQTIRDELKIMCVLYTEDVGGILELVFDEDGNLDFRTSCKENDFFYDEIGSVLKIKQYRNERRELLESIETYYRIVFLGEGLEEE